MLVYGSALSLVKGRGSKSLVVYMFSIGRQIFPLNTDVYNGSFGLPSFVLFTSMELAGPALLNCCCFIGTITVSFLAVL